MNSVTSFRQAQRRPERADAIARIRDRVRRRFTLTDETTILVAEIACAIPGCPPLETVVVFWTGAGRHHFKVFKPVSEIAEDDLPPAFMKSAIVAVEGLDCECC